MMSKYDLLLKNIKILYPHFLQLVRFGIVGVFASLLHFGIVVALVEYQGLHPATAFAVAFFISFQLSYWGHRLWTFKATTTTHRVALTRLLSLQIVNLLASESLFSFLLFNKIPYTIALLITLMIMPCFTFIFSKRWVFSN